MTLKERVEVLATRMGNYIRDNILPRLLPSGGTSGQVLSKSSNSDYAVQWVNQSAGVTINDAASNGTQTYSSNKVNELIQTAKNEILGGASSAYDTLLELESALSSNDSSITNLLTAVGNRVRYDAAQSLTSTQYNQACANLNIGNPDTDFVGVFNAALA